MKVLHVLWIALCSASLAATAKRDVTVATSSGKVRGWIDELQGREFSSFLGIPYAAPPVGDLRWQSARAPASWGDDVFDATQHRAACPQAVMAPYEPKDIPKELLDCGEENEDCLHLNVFVTGDASDVREEPLPVIVIIHGGGFTLGYSKFESGGAFVTQSTPVVMVAIQYRLGLFGFLTSGDDAIPGNLGLRDQTFALRWVQDNIAAFGGDPNRVTIAGESSGGESVVSHMVSPMSAGLFRAAIAQSSPAAWIKPTLESGKDFFKTIAETYGCASDGFTSETLACLRQVPWRDFMNNSIIYDSAVSTRVIDNEFFTGQPRDLWADGKMHDVDFMAGFTSDDGKMMSDFYFGAEFDFALNRSRDVEFFDASKTYMLKTHLEENVNFTDAFGESVKRSGKLLANRNDLLTMIKARYVDSQPTPLAKARGVLDSHRDVFFSAFTLYTAVQSAKHGRNVYVYIFDHATELLELNKPGGLKIGAPHAGELPYQFGYGLSHPDEIPMTSDELKLTQSVIHAWVSFAVGKPSYLTMTGDDVTWPRYTSDEHTVLTFDTNMSRDSANDDIDWEAMTEFWVAIDSLSQWTDEEEVARETTKEEL